MMSTLNGTARSTKAVLAGTVALAALMAPASAGAQLLGQVTQRACDPVQTLARTTADIPVAGPGVQTGADLACALVAAEVTWVTVYDPPGAAAPERREHIGVVGVPALLDVDGNPGPELVATLTVLPTGGASIAVDRFAGATGPLALSVEAVAAIPQGQGRLAAVGYDALASNAPQSFRADFGFQGDTNSVTLSQTGAGSSMAITGELFNRGAGGVRVKPQRLRIGLTPVPANIAATATLGGDASQIVMTADVPSTAVVGGEYYGSSGTARADALIEELPRRMQLDIRDGGSGAKELHYEASDPISRIDASLTKTQGADVVQAARLRVDDLPTEIDITQPGPDSIELIANNPIGAIEGGFASGGDVILLDITTPYAAFVRDEWGVMSSAVLARGVRHLKAETSDDLSLQATLQPTPFRLVVEDGARTIDGLVENLPSNIDLSYSPANGRIEYTADAGIGRISVRAGDPAGLLGRATDVALDIESLPSALTLTFGRDGNDVGIDAHGAHIGLLAFTATNGPHLTIQPDADGVEFRDSGGPVLLGARVHGLRKVVATLAPDPDLFVDATGDRVFVADLNSEDGTFIRARLDRLKPRTRIRVLPHGSDGSRITYGAAAPSTSLFFTTNGDDESDWMEATIAPVPASLSLCNSKDAACNNSGGAGANSGAMRFDASQPTLINMFQCGKPLTGCTEVNAQEFTRITNLTAQTVGYDADTNGATGRVFFDTDDRPLHGRIEIKLDNPVAKKVDATLPFGFKAQDRLVRWPGSEQVTVCVPFVGCRVETFPTPVSRTGSITCPAGTDFVIDLASPLPDVDVDFFLCG